MSDVFVAYPFVERARSILNSTIRPALASERLVCVTAHVDMNGCVVDVVRGAIERSVAVIAIVLDRNPNVFFEIGMASAYKKRCILIADSEGDVAMLRGVYPVITIQSSDKLLLHLTRHVRAWGKFESLRVGC